MCRNAYNIDLVTECGVEYPPGAGVAADFLHQSDVIGAFHALHKLSEWAQCNETIADQMWSPHSRPSAQLLPDLLQDMPVLIYAGELDLMCNYIGLESAIEHLQWGGLTGLANTTSSTWTVDGREIGSWRTRDKLSFVRLANASHMVMLEEPAAAHDMLLRFTGIDTLMAAGPSAQVPSRLGPFNGTEVVLGKLTPQGAALVDSEPGDEGTSVHQSDGQEEEEEHDKEREARYGPRRFAVLALLVLLAGVMMAVGLRWMSKQRRQRQIHRARSRKGKGRASEESIALVKEEGRRLRKDAAELEALIFRNSES